MKTLLRLTFFSILALTLTLTPAGPSLAQEKYQLRQVSQGEALEVEQIEIAQVDREAWRRNGVIREPQLQFEIAGAGKASQFLKISIPPEIFDGAKDAFNHIRDELKKEARDIGWWDGAKTAGSGGTIAGFLSGCGFVYYLMTRRREEK